MARPLISLCIFPFIYKDSFWRSRKKQIAFIVLEVYTFEYIHEQYIKLLAI